MHPAFELDWNLIRSFVAVAQAGSLAAGARHLGVSHPTAARHIQQLEEALGFTLFSRTSAGLVPNELGDQVRQAALAMHDAALAFRSVSEQVRHDPVPRVRLGVAESLAELLPDLMFAHGSGAEAGVAVDLIVAGDLLNLLQRDADMALRHVRPEQQELLCKKVGVLRLGLYAHADYVARQGVWDGTQTGEHSFIDDLTRASLVHGAAVRGISIAEEQLVFRSDSVACRRAAVRSGWGIAALPRWMARIEQDWVELIPEQPAIEIDVWLVARPEVRHSLHLRQLFTSLGDALQSQLCAPDAH